MTLHLGATSPTVAQEEGTADVAPGEQPAPPVVPGEEASSSWDETLGEIFTGDLTGRGLIELRDPFPLAVLHVGLPVSTLEVLESEQGKFEFAFNWANNFAEDSSSSTNEAVLVDAETYRLQLDGWYALDDDFYVGASISIHARGNGILDGLVKGFHESFGLDDGGRDDQAKDDYTILVVDSAGREVELDRGVGLGDLVLKTHWNVSRGDRWYPAVSVETLISLPTSTKGFGNDGIDVGVAFSFYKTFIKQLHLYAVVGAAYYADSKTEGLRYERFNYQAVLGIEYAVTEDVSVIVQSLHYSPLLKEPRVLNKGRNYIAAGVKWEFVESMQFEFSIVENIAPFDNSADIAFNIGFGFTF